MSLVLGGLALCRLLVSGTVPTSGLLSLARGLSALPDVQLLYKMCFVNIHLSMDPVPVIRAAGAQAHGCFSVRPGEKAEGSSKFEKQR